MFRISSLADDVATVERAPGLNLVILVIVRWTLTCLLDAFAHLRSVGKAAPDDLLMHNSPVGWGHIAFSGGFLWGRVAKSVWWKPLNMSAKQRAAP
ncbi:Tn3 family transposase [Labrys neptuniae]